MFCMMEVKLTLGQEVKKRRKRAGWTQEQLGELIGKTRETVSQIERDRRHDLQDDTFAGLEQHLGISRQDAMERLGRLPDTETVETIATLFEIVAIKDRAERRRAWYALSPALRQAILLLGSDNAIELGEQLAEAHQQSNPDP